MSDSEVIRDLAKLHGHESLSNSQVSEVRGHLADGYIDSILDGKPMTTETTTPIESQSQEN